MRLLLFKDSKKRPQGQGDHQSEHHVRHEDTREEKEPDAGRHTKTGIEAGAAPESPGSKRCGSEAKGDSGEGDGNARRPIMDAEYLIGDRDHPIDERRFFEIGHSIQARRNPITGTEHIPGDLGLHRIDVVH